MHSLNYFKATKYLYVFFVCISQNSSEGWLRSSRIWFFSQEELRIGRIFVICLINCFNSIWIVFLFVPFGFHSDGFFLHRMDTFPYVIGYIDGLLFPDYHSKVISKQYMVNANTVLADQFWSERTVFESFPSVLEKNYGVAPSTLIGMST